MTQREKQLLRGVWRNMLRRCNDPKSEKYPLYGARGITVCNEWQSFNGFIRSLPKGYKIGLTLDRIDNNNGYSKENCRWATYKIQANNRRNNKVISFMNKTMTLSQWAEETGIKFSTIRQRYYVYRWPFSECLMPTYERKVV